MSLVQKVAPLALGLPQYVFLSILVSILTILLIQIFLGRYRYKVYVLAFAYFCEVYEGNFASSGDLASPVCLLEHIGLIFINISCVKFIINNLSRFLEILVKYLSS